MNWKPRLSGIEGLRIHAFPPEKVPELPAAIIQPGQPLAEYDRTLGGGIVYNFGVLVLTASGDEAEAWQELAAYVEPGGSRSVKSAVESDAESGVGAGQGRAVDWFRVGQAEGGARTLYNKSPYWSVTFHVQAYVGQS